MKKLFTFLIAMACSGICLLYSQNANTELSNLVSTSVNQSLLPNTDNSRDLGSVSKSWKDAYIDGYLYLDGYRAVTNIGLLSWFFGFDAGNTTSTGGELTAVGYNSLKSNTTGWENSALGYKALTSNTAGYENSAFGASALVANTTGDGNAAFGHFALAANSISNDNSAFGNQALRNTTSGSNCGFGYNTFYDNTTGYSNTGMGAEAGNGNTNGFQNSFYGFDAGGSNTTGDNNTHIGFSSEGGSATYNNSHSFGYQTSTTASNQVRIGNSSVTSIGGYASWTNISDGRFKENIKEDVIGLDFITKLRPVTYTLDLNGIDAFIGTDITRDNENEEAKQSADQAIQEKSKIVYTGFIAQEVEAAAKELNYNFSGVDAPKNETDMYGLRYAEFVVPLVKAVQELSATNVELSAGLLAAQTENTELKSRLDKIEAVLNISETTSAEDENFQKVVLSLKGATAVLGQNTPNPLNAKTIIQYYIPETSTSSQIRITTKNGIELKTINVVRGQNSVEIDATQFTSGNYLYSLVVDGRIVDTKQMIITK